MESLVSKLKKTLKGKVLFLGMGNTLKSDDAAGVIFLKRLKESEWVKNITAEFWDCSVSPENYLEKIIKNNFDTIIIIDAVHMDKDPGYMDLIDPQNIESFSVSTHSLSPGMFVQYITGQSKATIKFLGIQPKSVSLKEGLSPEVSSSIDRFIDSL